MFEVVVGHSDDVDSDDAIAEILEQCSEQLNGQMPQAGMLLAAVDLDYPLILDRIQTTFPDMPLIGCTTDGELSTVMGCSEDSLSLMLFCCDTVTIRAGIGRGLSKDATAAAQQAIEQAQPTPTAATPTSTAKLCIVLADGLAATMEPALAALQAQLPEGTPIVGGLAGDQFRFEQTHQFFNNEVLQNGLVTLVFYGDDLKVSCGVDSGWQPLSRKATVTRAEGRIVYEIDNQPTRDFFESYIGGLSLFGEYPLAVFEADSDQFYLRTSVDNQENNSHIAFMGEIPEGSTVQITHATTDQILSATQTSVQQAIERYPGQQPTAGLIFSCAARKWLLGPRVSEEYTRCHALLDPAIPFSGFYTYGEIAPLEDGGTVQFHQETLVVVLLGVE